MNIPTIKFNDGNIIPQLGLGTWQVKDRDIFNKAFEAAIYNGYRHFDSAQIYNNEHLLGESWKASSLDRNDLFITTKISVQNFGEHKAEKSFIESLKNLQTDYVDLLLLHFPVTILRKNTWLALEKIKSEGGAKSIGVSNYTIRHLKEMNQYASIKPVVNQVELHLFLQQPELVKYCLDNDIAIEAYSPLARMHETENSTITKVADKYKKTYTQIMLRWLVDQGYIVIPKSVNPSRIKENYDIFDFKLDESDLFELSKLDKEMRVCWSPVHVP